MRRHWQHTTSCMGQCVSSCGSKRTLDSVPTTPDTENYPPGLIFSSSRSSSKCSSNLPFDNLPYHHQVLALSSASRSQSQSPAARFVTNFSKKKIVARRINPGGESPVHVTKHPSPSHLPLHTTTHLTPAPLASQDGDMRGTPVKNYFRETISSAKKSAASKSVTFSAEVVPPPPLSSSTQRKHFFSFSTTLTAKSSKKELQEQQSNEGTQSSSSSSGRRGFLRRKSKSRSPTPVTVSKPLNEKQICRVTLSPKQGSSKGGLLPSPSSGSSFSFNPLKREAKRTDGVETGGSNVINSKKLIRN